MKKQISVFISAVLLIFLQSCSVKTETTYYKDSATSMESKVLMDQNMMSFMNMMDKDAAAKTSIGNLNDLPTEWKSLYDIQKKGKFVMNEDSAKVLKKMFMKVNKSNGQILGVSMKYDKLMPGEIMQLLSQSRQLNRIPLQNMAQWNGKSLTIDTEKFNNADFLSEISKNANTSDTTKPKTKSDSIQAYGKQMAQSMIGMMKMFNMNFSNTLKFQKPIKTIVGKHDYVKQIDDKTIQINVNTRDLFDENKKLTNKDKQIVITTE